MITSLTAGALSYYPKLIFLFVSLSNSSRNDRINSDLSHNMIASIESTFLASNTALEIL